MSSATVKPGQTLLDVAIQYCGDESAVWELARLNGLGLTEDVVAGTVLVLPKVVSSRVVRVFTEQAWVPAAGVDVPVLTGIDYWSIELQFEVQ